jgi:hypothetical protein
MDYDILSVDTEASDLAGVNDGIFYDGNGIGYDMPTAHSPFSEVSVR